MDKSYVLIFYELLFIRKSSVAGVVNISLSVQFGQNKAVFYLQSKSLGIIWNFLSYIQKTFIF
jgi:hypothetical protein